MVHCKIGNQANTTSNVLTVELSTMPPSMPQLCKPEQKSTWLWWATTYTCCHTPMQLQHNRQLWNQIKQMQGSLHRTSLIHRNPGKQGNKILEINKASSRLSYCRLGPPMGSIHVDWNGAPTTRQYIHTHHRSNIITSYKPHSTHTDIVQIWTTNIRNSY